MLPVFIGSYLCKKLLESVEGVKIIGLDSITDYYDVSLKDERLAMLKKLNKDFTLIKVSMPARDFINRVKTFFWTEEYRF